MDSTKKFWSKNKYFMIFLVFVLGLAVFTWAVWLIATGSGQTVKQAGSAPVKPSLNEFNEAIGGDDKLVFNVSSNTDGPKIYKVIIAPKKVARGQTQYLEVWVKDETGVKSVTTDTELDKGVKKHLNMELYEGSAQDGKWRAAWVVRDTHDKTYTTTFTAVSADDRNTSVAYGWLDPCSPNPTGDWVISGTGNNCDMGGYVGTDGGNITVGDGANPATLVLEASGANTPTSLVFTPGTTITMAQYASISLCEGCEIKKGYIFVLDEDSDSVPAGNDDVDTSKRVFSSDPGVATSTGVLVTQSGGKYYTRLANLGSISGGITSGDCGPYDPEARPGQTKFFRDRTFVNVVNPDARGDYDCDGSLNLAVSTIQAESVPETDVFYKDAGGSFINLYGIDAADRTCKQYSFVSGRDSTNWGDLNKCDSTAFWEPEERVCSSITYNPDDNQDNYSQKIARLFSNVFDLIIPPANSIGLSAMGYYLNNTCTVCIGTQGAPVYGYCR